MASPGSDIRNVPCDKKSFPSRDFPMLPMMLHDLAVRCENLSNELVSCYSVERYYHDRLLNSPEYLLSAFRSW